MVLFKQAGAMVSEGVDTVVVEGAATLVSVGEQQSLPDCLHIDVQKRKFKIQTNNLHQPARALLVAMMGIYVMKLVPVFDIAPNLMGPLEKRHSSESPVLNYQICIDMLMYLWPEHLPASLYWVSQSLSTFQ
ncbi:unnamed protein product [Sphagnum troendelagicum]|uniref:Uncharacterized protein n=1 Tax=Sphagnum troendelagicum TaxID=128251 RepID=A0ABP0UEY8_9BRYO